MGANFYFFFLAVYLQDCGEVFLSLPCLSGSWRGVTLPVALLLLLPVGEKPFAHIIIDCVCPLPQIEEKGMSIFSPWGHDLTEHKKSYIILLGYSLGQVCQKSFLSDRGSNFTSMLYKQVVAELKRSPKYCCGYHPQSQGAIEQFHKIFVEAHPKGWDEAI